MKASQNIITLFLSLLILIMGQSDFNAHASAQDDFRRLLGDGSPLVDFNNDGLVNSADVAAFIQSYNTYNGSPRFNLGDVIFPSAVYSQGYLDPVLQMTGPQLDRNGNYRMNNCYLGSNRTTLVSSADHDNAIDICKSEAHESGLLEYVENGTTKYLEFGGIAGHYTTFSASGQNSGSLLYDNPYFPVPSNITDPAARIDYPKCDASKGFSTYQIAGSFARDYAMYICFAKRSSPGDAAYPDKIYGGVVSQASSCPSNFTASQIRGTIGNPFGFDPTYQLDPDLFLCHGERDGSNTGDKPVQIVSFILKGIRPDGSSVQVQDLGLPSSSSVIEITMNDSLYSSYAVETAVTYEGSLATPSQFPAGSPVPFRIDYTNSGPGLIGRASGADYLPPYHAAGDSSITLPNALFSSTIEGLHLIQASPARTDTTPGQYSSDSDLGESQEIRINFSRDGSGALDPDTLPPSVPSNLNLVSATDTSLSISWSASTDAASSTQVVSGVKGYKVSLNGTLGSQVYTNTQATLSGLNANQSYQVAVLAVDNADNQSALSGSKSYSTTNDGSNNGDTDDAGFSIFTPSSDTRIYYVSSSGNDSNNGTSESTPLKTIEKGLQKLRDGYPDWLLIKRGDTFNIGTTLQVTKSGRSAAQKARIGAYGSGVRPILSGTTKPFWIKSYTKNLVVEGLHFRNGGGADYGVDMLGVGYEDIRLEDLLVEGFSKDNLRLDNENAKYGESNTIPYRNIELFRVLSFDAHGQSHSQGFYAMGVENLTLEECIIDRNGWDASVGRSTATEYAHNIYLQRNQRDGDGDYTAPKILRSIITRGSSHGVQSRNGGLVEDSFFSGNAIGILVGNENIHRNEVPVSAIVRNNVLLDPVNINDNKNGGMGIDFQGLKQGIIENNIISNIKQQASQLEAYGLRGVRRTDNHTITKNVTLQNNISFQSGSVKIDPNGADIINVLFRNNDFVDQLTNPARFVNFRDTSNGVPDFASNRYRSSDPKPFDIVGTLLSFANWKVEYEPTATEFTPSYPDRTRNLNTYAASIGLSNESGFYNRLREQRKGNWRPDLEATEINNYIRAGFGR